MIIGQGSTCEKVLVKIFSYINSENQEQEPQ